MNISQLPYIIAIASTGNLSAAARQLGISQPALSKFLKNTERDVGQELFFRSQNRYIPTPAGQVYLSTAQQILNLDNHTRSAIAALSGSSGTTLRVGLSPNRGMNTMVSVYPDFAQRFPGVELVTTEGYSAPLLESLLAGKLDIIFISPINAIPDELYVVPTQKEELVLAVPSFHPLVKHNTFQLSELPYADLSDFRDYTFTSPGPKTAMYGLIQKLFQAEGIIPQVTATAPNILMQEAMIRGGNKVGILPAYYVQPNPDIAFFRLRNSPFLTCCGMLRKDMALTPPLEYLLFLFFRASLHTFNGIPIWTDITRRLVRQFDPLEAAAFGLEEKP